MLTVEQTQNNIKPSRQFEIVCDSACDLEPSFYEQHELYCAFYHLQLSQDRIVSQKDISIDDFYRILATNKRRPKVISPAVSSYLSLFRCLEETGAKKIISVHASSSLSSSYGAALTAAADFSQKLIIKVLDTKLVSAAEALVIKKLTLLRDEGYTLYEALEQIQTFIEKIHLLFVPGDKKHAAQLLSSQMRKKRESFSHGGLLSIGSFLSRATQYKSTPLMSCSAEGKIEVLSNAPDLPRKAALIARIMSGVSQREGKLAYIELCSGIPAQLQKLEKPLDTNEFAHECIDIVHVGSVVASCVGLGAIGIVFAPEELIKDVWNIK